MVGLFFIPPHTLLLRYPKHHPFAPSKHFGEVHLLGMGGDDPHLGRTPKVKTKDLTGLR